ncbi:conserved hypothetical protein [Afipia carboxidovorans OM5]|uniref:Uncharacterized protein n=1 Tax=Afipia carboxidovorans (strain ATCC 49405 / DSM 1227 / KCTC 32145 / OM5) TaxID=504832 RepID=B6JEF4_AFIC5|nr:hypothetical protein [Afipia carboxidovorans]ACI92719.1 conserved hypothetical protein [Afipia carboxidovorans OM5]AEI03529.1 hypothetical protein OCA4_c24090 [Afipia carboxidovorans OM4]AEI07106.1 hypothetical protein OCA5_c24100 [Afipia carboxidovorans OM5]BEV44682.1 hypothetical protein CRBSH125_08650 [Afipia carboxidovorans]
MSQRILFNDAEVLENEDVEGIGASAQGALDNVVSDAIGYPAHWAGFTATQQSAQIVRLTPGRYYTDDIVYAADASTDINLQVHIPLAASDQRWVAIIMRGNVETETALRIFETSTDVETSVPVQQTAPKREVRAATFTVQQGVASPAPALRPVVAGTDAIVAWVLLSSQGIALIEPGEGSRVKSLYEVEKRVSVNEADLTNIKRRTTAIETDIVNITQRLSDIPHPTIIRQLKRDVAATRRLLALPDEARAYWYDPGLLQEEWDKTHASWLARVREGIRFPWAAERDAQLALLDPGSPAIRMAGTLLMPAWTEVTRLEVLSDGSNVNISQTTHTVVTAIRKEIARQVIEYGPTVTVCENNAEWANTAHLSVGELFTHNGETFEVVNIAGNVGWAGHVLRAVRKVITRTVNDVYWEYVREEIGVNGSVHGQTWLCSQPMILTSIDLDFAKVGATGDVHLFVCECDEGGAPNFKSVVVSTVKAPGDLSLDWVNFSFRPTLLESGKRYAWFTVTTGNHALGTVAGNSYTQGSRFVCTDGVWSQVVIDSDFAMRLNGASFAATRTVVEFDALTLENGMTEVRLLHGGWQPGGTSLIWEIQPSGSDEWQAMTFDNANGADSMVGLPALVRLRAIFVGTTDLQPAIVMDATARGYTFRPRGDMVAVSVDHEFGVSTTSVQIEAVLDCYDPGKHTAAPKLIIGSTVYTPTATVVTPDLINSEKRTLLASFTVPETTSARARIDMTSSEVTDEPFVQNIAMYAL